jgi:hypothetical protein
VLENEVWLKLGALLVSFLVVPEMLAMHSVLTRSAFADIDPGSGHLAFQILSIILAGVRFFIRKRLLRLLLRTHIIPMSEALNKR